MFVCHYLFFILQVTRPVISILVVHELTLNCIKFQSEICLFWSSDLLIFIFSQIHFLIHPSRMQLTHWCIWSTAQCWRALFPFTSIMSKWSSNLIEVHELRELASFKFGCRKDSSLIERSVNSFHAIVACFWLFASVNFCYVRMGPLVMCGWGR